MTWRICFSSLEHPTASCFAFTGDCVGFRAGFLRCFLLKSQGSDIGDPLQLICDSSAEPASTVRHRQGWGSSCMPFPVAGGLAQHTGRTGINTGSLARAQEMGCVLPVCGEFAYRWDSVSPWHWSSPVQGATTERGKWQRGLTLLCLFSFITSIAVEKKKEECGRKLF